MARVLPKTLHEEPLPDNPRRVALLWGPLVLAGDQGPEHARSAGHPSTTVFVAAERPVAEWLKPVLGSPGRFRTDGVGRSTATNTVGAGSNNVSDVDFLPFYRLHRRTYAAYWDLYTPHEW